MRMRGLSYENKTALKHHKLVPGMHPEAARVCEDELEKALSKAE